MSNQETLEKRGHSLSLETISPEVDELCNVIAQAIERITKNKKANEHGRR